MSSRPKSLPLGCNRPAPSAIRLRGRHAAAGSTPRDDGDRPDARHSGTREQRRPHVEGEGSDPARARRVRREAVRTHAPL
jgi:hypothetical protein